VCSLTEREFYLGICPDPMSEPGFSQDFND
jgi:hypothetical protein